LFVAPPLRAAGSLATLTFHGFDGVAVTLRDDTVIHGLRLRSGNPTVFRSMGGVTQLNPSNRIRERLPVGRSLVLSADPLGLSGKDVADNAVYLKTQEILVLLFGAHHADPFSRANEHPIAKFPRVRTGIDIDPTRKVTTVEQFAKARRVLCP